MPTEEPNSHSAGRAEAHQRWREKRDKKGVDANGHPFRYQARRTWNTYKMFLETALELNREGGGWG